MKNELAKLSSVELLNRTRELAAEERKITQEVLWCIGEVEARLLFAELGYSSIYEFAIKYLHYSGGSAHRRISAARLLSTLPDEVPAKTEQKILDGSLNLTNVCLVEGLLKAEKKEKQKIYTPTEKEELLNAVQNQSKEKTLKILAEVNPHVVKSESIRVITPTQTQITFTVDDALLKKFERIKDLTAHKNPPPTYAQLFEMLADTMLEKLSKLKPEQKHDQNQEPELSDSSRSIPQASSRLNGNPIKSVCSTSPARSHCVKANQPAVNPRDEDLGAVRSAGKSKSSIQSSRSRAIPGAVKRAVWNRDEGRCTYLDRSTGNACSSRFGIEFDHIHPFALGGQHAIENLRLRCKVHNRLEAIKVFGPKKMKEFQRNSKI